MNDVQAELLVTSFLPDGYVRDGSEAYFEEMQKAINTAAERGETLRFPAMTYAANEGGWQLASKLTLDLRGATFHLPDSSQQDGAVFHGDNVTDVNIIGGEILGRNDVWKDGVNIRGLLFTGTSKRIRIRETCFRNLSSNGIGFFGDENQFIEDVWVENVVVENCCKRYPDYLSKEKGELGSVREDQGDVAFYFVDGFTVCGCRFERSRSDGTHFYRSRNGQIVDNRIYRAKMGGYFLEQCENVIGRSNVILENGSRGATIERGSTHCLFADNIVRNSGREGLWAPDCIGLVVTGNEFDLNGRKPNGPEPRFVWNANITINEASKEPTNSPTQDYLISNNLIRTSEDQIAAIRVDAVPDTQNIVIRGNLLVGENRKIIVEGVASDQVQLHDNRDNSDDNSDNRVQSIRATRVIAGWTLHIHRELLEKDAERALRAVELLKVQLQEIVRVVPKPVVESLQKVPLYFSPEYTAKKGGAEFHPSKAWLQENGRDPIMAKCVEFTNIANFEAENRRMPNFALHELAHAYHNLVLQDGFANRDIQAVFELAKSSGKYASVERRDSEGRTREERAYAITNSMEYFAEATEAYFSRNDFFPYTNDELKRYDPEMFDLLTKLWQVEASR
ncbi:MAG: right-handed parallel beta-helix repeat-containing protein [Pirellulaceae bacterium]|nr:right-handed parallel beta-helix repeat-containing protein [Pirellulaceae bacterium]